MVLSTRAYGQPVVIPAPPPPAATLEYGSTPIPANGGLIIHGTKAFTVLDDTVRVLAPDGTPVPGTLTGFESVTTWKPERPLTPGVTYDVTLLPRFGVDLSHPSNNYKIMVTPAHTPARPAMTSTLTVSRYEEDDGVRCCLNDGGAAISAMDLSCFKDGTSSAVAMKIGLLTTTPMLELAQYLSIVGMKGGSRTPSPPSSWSS